MRLVIAVILAAVVLGIAEPVQAEIAFVDNAAAGTWSNAASVSVPAGTHAGDLMLAQIAVRGGTCGAITPPSGWTLIRCDASSTTLVAATYWKVATGTDLNQQPQWTLGQNRRWVGAIGAWRGVDSALPVEADNGQANAASASVTAPGVVTTSPNALLVGLFAVASSQSNLYAPPPGMTELFEQASGGTGVTAMMAYGVQAVAGGSGDKQAPISISTAVSTGQLLALRPATPVADYHFDECSLSAGSSVADSSTNALNGTAAGGVSSLSSGQLCRAANFNGTNAYVMVADNSLLDLRNQISVAAWVRHRTNSYRSWEAILAKGDNTYRLHLNGGCSINTPNPASGLTMGFNGGCADSDTNSNVVPAAGTWYHVAAAFDGATVRIYVNGALRATTTPPSTQLNANNLALYIGENSQQTGRYWDGDLDEVTLWDYALTSSEVSAHMSRTRTCPVCAGTLPGRFNAFDTATPAGAIVGNIKTKVAGQTFSLDLVAVKADNSGPETGFSGTVKVELLNAADDSGVLDATSMCRSSWVVLQTLSIQSFVAGGTGRITASGIVESNSWQDIRVRVSYPATGTATVVGCSTDDFAIRPASFTTPSASDSDWAIAGTSRALTNTAASGGVVHKAGRPFTVRTTAVNAAATPAVTTNYSGTPTAVVTVCGAGGCGAVAGALTLASGAVSGVLNDNNATYSEAGAFSLQLVDQTFANVDIGDSTTTERYITSPLVTVGRFVPDYFDITGAAVPVFKTFNDTSCTTRSFTYIGQGFGYVTLPRATITARNAAGGTTASYRDALWKLTAGSITQTYTPLAPATPGLDISAVGTVSVASNNDGTGSYAANSGDLLVFVRNTTAPQAQFNATITLSVSAADGSESAVAGNGTITTAAPLVFNGSGSGIAFDAGNLFRYGRLKLGNAYGSERLDLPVPLTAQYWNGYAFATNAADYCTRIDAANIKLSGYQPAGFVASVPQANVSISGRLSAGIANLKLLKPAPAASGSLNLCIDLDIGAAGDTTCQASTPAARPYLQDRRTAATYTQDPAGRAAFGLYKGPNNFIYFRENY